jgi:hypothetical protein
MLVAGPITQHPLRELSTLLDKKFCAIIKILKLKVELSRSFFLAQGKIIKIK